MSTVAEMAEIDLIPADYRSEQNLLRLLRRAGILLLLIVAALAALAAGLRHAAATVRSEVQRLDAAAAGVELQRSTVAALASRKAALEAEVSQLETLRDGRAILSSMTTVSRALSGDRLWFLEWRFERNEPVDGGSSPPGPQPVRVQMGIDGQAQDHAAVSAFVGALLGEPGIADVRILRTSRDEKANFVDFELLVVDDVPDATP